MGGPDGERRGGQGATELLKGSGDALRCTREGQDRPFLCNACRARYFFMENPPVCLFVFPSNVSKRMDV